MTNEDKIKAITYWRTSGYTHPLTCGKDSRHFLYGYETIDGKVILICNDCNYKQDIIPEVVFEIYLKRKEFEKIYGGTYPIP